jgi:hypothetical protein
VICIYALQLTATNAKGQSASTEKAVIDSGQMKVSNFTLPFSDLLRRFRGSMSCSANIQGRNLIPNEI